MGAGLLFLANYATLHLTLISGVLFMSETQIQEIKTKLAKEGQMQLMRFFDQLGEAEKENLLRQIEHVDFDMIRHAMASPASASRESLIEPIHTVTVKEQETQQKRWEKVGREALSQGKAAAVILAGGQGTRLGFNGPKGTLNVGITKEKYLFEILLENIRRNTKGCEAVMPVYIMTSVVNHEATEQFLKAHDCFGYPKDKIHLFKQDMAPALSLDGKILMESPSSLCLAPNGNGGWFRSLLRAGLIEEMKADGVEWLNVVSVDNVLQNIGDPVFLGAAIDGGFGCGAKVISKVSPDERVGAICLRNHHPSVVEYTELTDEMRLARRENGEYLYQFGVTLNYLFKIADTEAKAGHTMPIHQAVKKVPCLDEAGNRIVPEEPNAIKMEYFIFDILEFFDDCLVYECIREDEFAPIKNKSGVDSLDTARDLYQAKFGQVL